MMMTVTSTDTMPALKLQEDSAAQGNLQPRNRNPIMKFSMDSAAAQSESPCFDSEMSEQDGGITTTKGIKMDTINETGGENEVEEDEYGEEGEQDVVMFVELKYCTVCHLEQPLRSKHCKSCDQCIATHDHHCPWIGNCVGERNKARFYYYLAV